MATPSKARHRRRISKFATGLLSELRRLNLPLKDEPIVIAVSGGADSTALLLAMHELKSVGPISNPLIVTHLDHGLRKTARRDAAAVSTLARKLGLKAVVGRADVRKMAIEHNDNLEQAARRARYTFLERTARRSDSRLIAVAHTMDDQAETVLLRLLRGSAGEGLSGMEPVRTLRSGSDIALVRPLLTWARRADTENYCRQQRIEFIVDEMNKDESFTRVKVRQQLLPLMESFNKRIVETLFRTASLLREDSTALADDAAKLLLAASEISADSDETGVPTLRVDVLAAAPAALRRRALRQWVLAGKGNLNRVEHVHLLGLERLLAGDKGGRIAELPNGMQVRRRKGRLELIRKAT